MNALLAVDILTLFPEMFDGAFAYGVIGRAVKNGIVQINTHDIRKQSNDRHRTVDDYAFGGGPGMVMKPEPLAKSIEQVQTDNSHVVLLSPQGQLLDQTSISRLSNCGQLILICGRYEGVDERISQKYVDEEISIGDYVVTGGEIPAMVITDAVVRLVPGVVGKEESLLAESHSSGLLEHPHYTRPRRFADLEVPEILVSGNHAAVAKWRRRESLRRTLLRRPDLLHKEILDRDELTWLLAEEPNAAHQFLAKRDARTH
jgi:tRNA (guanine37-N1)-methyltransferase